MSNEIVEISAAKKAGVTVKVYLIGQELGTLTNAPTVGVMCSGRATR